MSIHKKWPLAALLCAVLAGCGSSDGGDTTTRTTVTAVKVFGDSLADSGTFGIKFTVQGNLIYPERVAQTFGLSPGCNFFTFTGTTFAPNTTAANCNNFAIGGGVINGAGSGYTAADPRGVGVQMATAITARGAYSAGDLLVIDGGGNDAAALVGAYLRAATDGGVAYTTVLGTLLTPSQVGAAAAGGQAGLAAAGATYMSALADSFFNIIKTQALDRGATRIALLNMPGITNTPRFQFVLDGIAAAAAATGGASAGAAARAQSEALFKSWVVAFNTQLATKFAGNSSVVIVDFYTAFADQIATPAQFGLTNVRTPACPVAGTGADGLPTYNFATCTGPALSAAPLSGLSGADWWKAYGFSDSFHPTPYGHQLLAQLISRSLANAGWL